MTDRRLFPGNIEKRRKIKEYSFKLWDNFVRGDYRSLHDFINRTGYEKAYQNLTGLFKRHIPDFPRIHLECKGKATKPFASKDVREWMINNYGDLKIEGSHLLAT